MHVKYSLSLPAVTRAMCNKFCDYDTSENDSFEEAFEIDPFKKDVTDERTYVVSFFSIGAAATAFDLTGDDVRGLCHVGLLTSVNVQDRELVTFESMFRLLNHLSEHFPLHGPFADHSNLSRQDN